MVAQKTALKPLGDTSDNTASHADNVSADGRGAPAATPPRAGRGVLEGAFAVLEVLGQCEDGLGLTDLTRASGLAKTSAYRLAEQLVLLGAAQRVDQRYFIGARLGRIGQRWQPDPLLRHAAQARVHTLAVQTRAVVSLRVLDEDRLRTICSTVPRGHAHLPHPCDRTSTARTATGRVLYAARPGDTALPDCWTTHDWRQLRQSIRDPDITVVDRQEVFPGICCVSAPVWRPDGTCAAAVTAQLEATKWHAGLRDLVARAARRIGAGLR